MSSVEAELLLLLLKELHDEDFEVLILAPLQASTICCSLAPKVPAGGCHRTKALVGLSLSTFNSCQYYIKIIHLEKCKTL